MKKFLFSALTLAGILGTASPASAVLITGGFNFQLGQVTVELNEVDWTPPVNSGFDATVTYGAFEISSGGTRSGVWLDPVFNQPPIVANELIHDLSGNPADANYVPIGAGFTEDFFLIAEYPTWEFTATFLTPGQFGTPYTFTETGGSTTVAINVKGIAYDTTTPTLLSNWEAILSATYVGWTTDELFNCLVAGTQPSSNALGACGAGPAGPGGALPNNDWAGTFNALAAPPIPEPATLLTFGVGSALLAAHRRRRAKARKA